MIGQVKSFFLKSINREPITSPWSIQDIHLSINFTSALSLAHIISGTGLYFVSVFIFEVFIVLVVLKNGN